MGIKKKNNEIDMTQGPIFKHMLIMSLSIMGTMVMQQLFNTADLLVVGQFGEPGGVASVGSCSSIINLMINLFIGLSAGAGIVMASHYGAKNTEDASKCLHTSVTLSFIAGIALAVIAWFVAEPLLKLLKTPSENNVLAGAVIYMRIYFLGMPFVLLFNFCSSILRAVGDAKRTFEYIIQSGIINVILNLLFVIVFKLNVAGVAIATTVSQGYCAARCIILFLGYDGVLRLYPEKLRIYKTSLKEIARLGIPSGIQSSMFSFSNVFIQTAVNSFGAAATSGCAAAQNIESYLHFSTDSVKEALISYTSQNYGAGKPERIKRSACYAVVMVITVSAFLGFLIIIFGEQLLALYNVTDAAEVDYGLRRMKIIAASQVLGGLMNITAALLRGIFKPMPAMIFSIAGICGFRLVWIATVFRKYSSFEMLFASYPISWAVSFIAQGVMFFFLFKKYKEELNTVSLS